MIINTIIQDGLSHTKITCIEHSRETDLQQKPRLLSAL